VTLLPSFYSKN